MQEAGLKPLPALEIYNPARHLDTQESFQQQVRLLAGYLIEYVVRAEPIEAIMAVNERPAGAVTRRAQGACTVGCRTILPAVR